MKQKTSPVFFARFQPNRYRIEWKQAPNLVVRVLEQDGPQRRILDDRVVHVLGHRPRHEELTTEMGGEEKRNKEKKE